MEKERDFWEEQANLPIRRRDGLWWASVALPHVVLVVVAVVWASVFVYWLAR